MTAEVTLDGTVLKAGLSYPLGTDIKAQMGFFSPNNNWCLANKQFQAGEYHAIGYDMQGLSKAQIEKIKAKLETTKARIETQDQAQIATLTSHDVTGAMLQGLVQSYFALNDTQDMIAAGQSSVDKDNKAENWLNFNAVQGSRMSANEHLIPEWFFNDPNATSKNVEGISAVKAIQIAARACHQIADKYHLVVHTGEMTIRYALHDDPETRLKDLLQKLTNLFLGKSQR